MTIFAESLLYLLVAPAGEGSCYIKVGISQEIERRLSAVQTGCPLKIEEVCFVVMRSWADALAAEGQMHYRLAPYNSSGEWFLFDLNNPVHKRDFNTIARETLAPYLDAGWKWERVNVTKAKAAMRAENKILSRAETERANLNLLTALRSGRNSLYF